MQTANIIISDKRQELAELPDSEIQKVTIQIIKILNGKPLVYALTILQTAQELLINGPLVDINSPRLLAIQKEYNLSDP